VQYSRRNEHGTFSTLKQFGSQSNSLSEEISATCTLIWIKNSIQCNFVIISKKISFAVVATK
jgi:hypothetical protein